MVKASAQLLAPNVRQYVFISTISVYKSESVPNADESAPLATLADPTTEDMGKDFANYGGGKALCEKAVEAAMPGRVTNLRPGFMVGPRDTSGRFIYWPVRVSIGGTMAVPGSPADPIQLIDVRDVADWIIHCIEDHIVGIYNVTGPDKELPMRGMLESIRKGVGSEVSFTWIDNGFLEARHVPQDKFPLYVPPSADSAGFHRRSIARAFAWGLKFRPVSVTTKATLDWYQSLPPNIQAGVAPQFTKRPNEEPWLDTEKHLLEAWAKHRQDSANRK